jgi:hypothetical protein
MRPLAGWSWKVRAVTRIALPGAVVAAIAAVALAGCGGSSSSSKTTTPPTTAPPSSTTGGGGGARLTQSEWQTYETKNTAFVTANNKAIAKFRSCGTVAGRTTSADQYVNCMGDSATKVISATTDLGKTLHGFHPSASGQCTTALNDYIGALDQWRSVVQSVQASLSSAAPQSSGAAANARTQYPQVQSAAKTFTKECKPVA